MLAEVLLELLYKSLALAVTVWATHYLTTTYVQAVIEFTRAYLAVLDFLYSHGRLPTLV